MDKEKHRRKEMTVVLPSLCKSKKKPPQNVNLTRLMHKTQRSFLKRQLFLIFDSVIWQRVSLNRWSQDGCFSPLRGVETVWGITAWRHLHSFPTVSQLQKGRGEKTPRKRSSTAVMTPRIESALISRPRLETRLVFCPPSVGLSNSKRLRDGWKGDCLFWGGMCFRFRLMRPLHSPCSPSWHCTASHTPEIKVGPTGPLSVALAQSPMGWGSVVCSGATRSLPHFWVPRSLGGRTKRLLPISTPRVAGYGFWDTPGALDSGGSPSLYWTTDTKQRIDHTQAVQPSYSWARLSRFVASLMTKSTCGPPQTNGHKSLWLETRVNYDVC